MPISVSISTLTCCCILMIFFFKSSCTYVVDSNDLADGYIDQQYGLNIPSYFYDRTIRTTKFPRIGRFLLDSEENPSFFDLSSEENDNEINNNELRLIEKRSVLFPRIGKRAFHNLLWANSRSNPHRMLDSQGRYQTNGYDYHIHPVRPTVLSRYRVKRNM